MSIVSKEDKTMAHYYYACDILKRTCFELGKSMSADRDGFEDLLKLAVNKEVAMDEFMLFCQGIELGVMENTDKVAALYEYLTNIEPAGSYRLCYDDINELFRIEHFECPVYQVGSLFNNCDTWVFGKKYVDGPVERFIKDTERRCDEEGLTGYSGHWFRPYEHYNSTTGLWEPRSANSTPLVYLNVKAAFASCTPAEYAQESLQLNEAIDKGQFEPFNFNDSTRDCNFEDFDVDQDESKSGIKFKDYEDY